MAFRPCCFAMCFSYPAPVRQRLHRKAADRACLSQKKLFLNVEFIGIIAVISVTLADSPIMGTQKG